MMAQRQLSIASAGMQDWDFEEVRVRMESNGYRRGEICLPAEGSSTVDTHLLTMPEL
jgi:hypothetical protein